MRIVFCGNPEFALPTFERLLASHHEVAAVVTSPDQPKGRGRKLAPMPVKRAALEQRVPVLSPMKLRDPEFLSELINIAPDALVVVAFRILPREMFALPKWGALNVHPSLLPKGRGPAPIQWTLLRGETETGVTIIRLTETIDGGGMLAQERTAIGESENFGALHDRLALLGAHMLVTTLDRLDSGTPMIPLEQDESHVTTARKLKPADYDLSFSGSARSILSQIRAFSPAPGAVARAGDFSIKLLEAGAATEELSLSPGQIKQNQTCIWVGTADKPIQLKVVKPAGKNAMPVADYLRGRQEIPEFFDNLHSGVTDR
ncbi:MAG: methionyl-tRNA formyltransferase [bacterium]|nr:methionyl-tRNA formyltransferase [bacterium]